MPTTTTHPVPVPVLPIDRRDLPRDTVALARFLLGKVLAREFPQGMAFGRIVETEAYVPGDPAGHAFRGATRRNQSLFREAGHAYIYLCYGTSHLLNVSSEAAGIGAGVLLRALEPLAGIEHMRRRRARAPLRDLTRGPGCLTMAMQIDLRHDGVDMLAPGSLWLGSDGTRIEAHGVSTRIGLTKGADAQLRFFVAGSRHLSGPRRLNACAGSTDASAA